VIAVDEERKLVFVQDIEIGAARPFNAAQVKPYFTPDTLAHSFMMELDEHLRQFGSREEQNVFLTEIIDRKDSRATSPEMTAAKQAEVRDLLRRGTFKVILREDVPSDANVLPGRFVLAIKSTEDGKIKHKARYLIGGHRDRLKHMVIHLASTLQPQSIRLLLALAAIHGFDIWTSDVRQAHIYNLPSP